ncbi:hypothetical protein T03_5356 [Trichinella britovi]|uniref:Uncharacterized protein n=1 Tax=Trichinella britovi TaxID=45882 RepID=A0A0V1C5D3_TRIBR|nr:hypothetical protein T03_5356 [Trichinella britovi]
MLLLFPAIHGKSYGSSKNATGAGSAIRCGFHQALESLPCPVTILMLNCPFDIGDQEHLVEDVRDEKCPET